MKKKIAYLIITASIATATFFVGKSTAKEVIPENYIPISECIPLSDIANYYMGENGYPVFELKDVAHQMDDANNRSYEEIINTALENIEYWEVTDTGLDLYDYDGNLYQW